MMGALHGIPAVAASSGSRGDDFGYASRFVAGFVRELRSRGPVPGIVYSINVPRATEAEIRGVAVAKMGGMQYTFGFTEIVAGGQRTFRPQIGVVKEAPPESDTQAFLEDMVTITPLRFDWTAYSVLDELKGWKLSPRVGGN